VEITPVDVGAVITAIGGAGGLWAWLDKRREWKARAKKDAAEEAAQREEREVARLRQDMTEVKRQLDESRQAHSRCEEQVSALSERIDTIEQHHSSLLARWIKDDDKRIRWVNSRAMMLIFAPLGYSRGEIERKTFAELGLDATTVTEIDRLDRLAVIHPGETATTMLTIRRVGAPAGSLAELPPMFVAKVAGIGREGDLIYEGIAFRGVGDAEIERIGDLRQAEQRGVSTLRGLGALDD
jgi:hypothetical protein